MLALLAPRKKKRMSSSKLFEAVQERLSKEAEHRDAIREVVQEIDAASRALSLKLNGMHAQNADAQKVAEDAKKDFDAIGALYESKLSPLVSDDVFYKFHDHWKSVTIGLVTSAALIHFLENGTLIEQNDVTQLLRGFRVELEDFLHGLAGISSELGRLAMNSVTQGHFDFPVKIRDFVSDLYSGFRLLNLKNDSLRRKYDSIKYDLKRIEEVVFDVSIRGLSKDTAQGTSNAQS